jgi:signal transduction histidine kinase
MIQRIAHSDDSTKPDHRLRNRTRQLLSTHRHQSQQKTEIWLRHLLGLEWLVTAVVALVVYPQDLFGAPIISKFLLCSATVLGLLAYSTSWLAPCFGSNRFLVRHSIAVSQSIWIYVLIQLTGGQVDPLPLAFGSLLLLACFRDGKVLISASLVLAIFHSLYLLSLSVTSHNMAHRILIEFGEHVGWILFVDICLVTLQIRMGRDELQIFERLAADEMTNQQLADRFTERSRELDDAENQLLDEYESQRQSQKQNERIYGELVAASRRADVAEAATDALHNIGNVLNSINVSASVLQTKLAGSRIGRLDHASAVLKEQEGQLQPSMSQNERGKYFPQPIEEFSATLVQERDELLDELQSMLNNLEHVHQIVASHQEISVAGSFTTPVQLDKLVEDAICINQSRLDQYAIEVVREFDDLPLIFTDKHKVLQVLVNLILNAQQALARADIQNKTIRVTTGTHRRSAMIKVSDNGPGIAQANLARVFDQGFTTKNDGHGLGLHSSATAAAELGGHLSAQSRGVGCGATFILELPFKKESACTT